MKSVFKSETKQTLHGSKRRLAWHLSTAFAALAVVEGCTSGDTLQSLQQVIASSSVPNGVTVNFCTDPAYNQKQYLKTIIILDHSGSNKENYLMSSDGTGAPALVNGSLVISPQYATDPLGLTRYGTVATPGTLLNYLSALPANNPTDPTKFFALVDFNSQVTTYPANSAGFTSNISAFFNYVQSDATSGTAGAPTDGGSTSYLAALASAYNIMNSDIQSATNCAALPLGSVSPGAWCPTPGVQIASSYVIVFMSDGSPITNISGVGTDANGNVVVTGAITITKESSTDILGQVGSIMALASNATFVTSVNLFSIYYYAPGNVDTSGQSLLAAMAKAGSGIAYNALSGTNINYSQFQPPAKRIKFALSDIFVTNSSVAWWTDGQLHADTDMDGLPDFIETAWGSDPTKASSDKNGVSDLVKYRLSNAKACTTKNAMGLCIDPVTNYASGACSSITSSKTAGITTFKSSDPNGLNDCEKTLLGDTPGINNPDSNDDLIPDWLEFKNSVPFQVGAAPAISIQNQDGYSDYQKIKLSLPFAEPASEVLNLTPATYNLTMLSTNETQDCYSLVVNHLPTIGNGNTIRVDVIEKSELLSSNYLYRVGKKTYAPGSQVLEFNDWNNAAEQAAKTWSVWILRLMTV